MLALALAVALLQDLAQVEEKFKSARPPEKDLALYTLDWGPSLKEAKERAAKDKRPIFLIVVTNSYGDLFTGH